MIEAFNPATGAAIATYHAHAPAQVETRLAQHCAALVRLAALLRAGRDTQARLSASEMGEPLVEAEAELGKSALSCEFYAGRAPGCLADTPVASATAYGWWSTHRSAWRSR
ncbi:aldehyde dehydrogenase family protein [Pseudomonas sp. 102515]|uniref:aldehyde dehydrogenase family protein n=1 Tax=Pseudomonas sp. 102515 TaxID=3071568 RepID=UPI002800740A|nr:aldehyde dehydrogenase family protein [Pseudomonas sp. 102515]MDQ7915571.1 aldehyde dehydrogenase family protein [Pseudomonas sp. 102515]